MTPDQVRAAASILDQIDRLASVLVNTEPASETEWTVTSTVKRANALATVGDDVARAMLTAGIEHLWDRFRKLGGKIPGDPEVQP